MQNLDKRFNRAVADVRTLPDRPDNDRLLELYALYKQATEGDVQGGRPSMFDFAAMAKHEAWKKLRGMDPQAAMERYAELVENLKKNQ